MRKVKSRRIKARKAYTQKTRYLVCDLCSKEVRESDNRGYCGYRPIGECLRCKREVCEKCTHYETDPCSDCADRYCKVCWKLYKDKYRKILDKKESEWLDLEKRIKRQWEEESLTI